MRLEEKGEAEDKEQDIPAIIKNQPRTKKTALETILIHQNLVRGERH